MVVPTVFSMLASFVLLISLSLPPACLPGQHAMVQMVKADANSLAVDDLGRWPDSDAGPDLLPVAVPAAVATVFESSQRVSFSQPAPVITPSFYPLHFSRPPPRPYFS